ALGYDSAYVLAEAIKRAATTEPAALRDAIAGTKDFDGVTGKFTLDANRNAIKSAAILQIKGGKFTFLETIAP
ncbi:MAG: ABC transporter substrate-binding protein, partial [Gloeobacteraceae cyanobacterium ES-bin-144]|nr:ABC transporter substrate-binding protein [Verrucomicrobiales bacterium]